MSVSINTSPTLSDEQGKQQLELDKQSVNAFLDGKDKTFDFQSYKRLVLTELSTNHFITESKICGFSAKQIQSMVDKPERYGKRIIQLSQFMYLKSGYYKRLINYFVNMVKYCWTVDMEVKDSKYSKVSTSAIQNNLVKFIAQVNSFKLEYELPNIFLNVYLNDACFGFLVETEYDSFIYYLKPECCEIKSTVNGTYSFVVNTGMFSPQKLREMPVELQQIITDAKENSQLQVAIPYDKSICIKYHEGFTFLYPPLFELIASVLLIDDYKALMKAKTQNEAYQLLCMEIPTDENGQIALGDDMVRPFTQMAQGIVPKTIGILPSPMKVSAIQFKPDTNEKNKVEIATNNFYDEAGVSQSLLASSGSGSELKISIEADASDLYRTYRQVEKWVNLQAKLRGHIYPSYNFNFSMLDVTVYNQSELINREMKLAQVSAPNKMKLMATSGVNPAKLLGNDFMENTVLQLGSNWMPLNTSFTQSAGENNGRPQKSETDLSPAGEQTRKDEGNDKGNRI